MQLQKISSWLIWGFIILSFIGFADAAYLTAKYYAGTSIPCSFLKGCDVVTKSSYSDIFGIPVSLPGAVYYLLIFLGTIIYFDTKNQRLLAGLAKFTIIGLLASIWFVSLQVFVIKAFCLYCIISAVTSTLLFLLGLKVLQLNKTNAQN